MSLLAWYPLISNGNNQGLDGVDLTTMGTIPYNPGILGASSSFSQVASNCLHRPAFSMTDKFSWAAWIKVNSTESTAQQFILSQGRDTGSIGFNIRCNNSRLIFLNCTAGTINIVTPAADTWVHVAVTVDSNDKIKAFANGIECATSLTYKEPDFAQSSNRFVIGKMAYSYTGTSTYFPFNGQVQDVRVYDHVLSKKEIKEISKGLSIHLPLKPLNVNPNLYKNSVTMSDGRGAGGVFTYTNKSDDGLYTRITCTTSGYGPYFAGHVGRRNVGDVLTWSCDMRASKNTTKAVGHEAGGRENKSITTEWKKFTKTWTVTHYTYNSFTIYNEWEAGDWLDIRNLKIEEGSEATPWCPNIYDNEYTRLGYGTRTLPYTFAGSPTNNLGYISNFSTTNYINTGYTFNPGSNIWEVTTRLTTGTDITTQQYIEGCMGIENNYGVLFGTATDSKTVLWISSAGVSWDIANGVKGSEVAASTTYWFKYGFDGSKYYLKRSTDGGNTYTTEIEVTSTTAIKAMAFHLGSCWDKAKPFKGAIDMDKFSITVNKNLAYTGTPIYGNNFVLQDRSGYNRSTTMQGRLTPVSSPTGLGTNFTMSGRIICNNGFPSGTQPPFTIAFWHKPNDCIFSTWSDVCGLDVGTASSTSFGGYFRLEAYNNTGKNYSWYGNGYVTNGGYFCVNTAETGVWRHVALTFDGTNFKQYVNGAQVSAATLGETYSGFKTYGRFYVGDTGMYMDMSDCRVYGTCLSAEDVKALYNTPIAVDKTGKLYCREITEEDSIKYKKTGEFQGTPNEGDYDKLSLCKNGNVNAPDIYEI